MVLQQSLIRHTASVINPSLIESWCLKCGVFIAASNDEQKLQAADNSHSCINLPKKSPSSRRPDGDSRGTC